MLLCHGAAALVIAGCAGESAAPATSVPSSRPEPPRGVRVFNDLATDHLEGPIAYDESPPVGGPHNAVPQSCGFYSAPVAPEHAVHSLEHGAVWITYPPDLPDADVERLAQLAGDKVLVSAWEDLDAPVVASAWGRQLELDSADDPRLEAFIATFVNGAQSPEPTAACRGVGTSGDLRITDEPSVELDA
jgi:hypothetical protein